MRPSLPGYVALAGSFILACADVSSPTGPTVAAEAVSAQPAALVSRFTGPFFQFLVDGDLIAVMGLSPDQLPALCAGDESVLDELHFQEVTRPDGSLKLVLRARPRLIIYSIAGVSDLCDLSAVAPLATGKIQMTQTDNDLFVSLRRTNSVGTNLGGIASGAGGRFKVRGRFRITIKRNGDFLVRNERFGITRLGG